MGRKNEFISIENRQEMVYTNLFEFDCDISNFSSVHHAAFVYRNQPVLSNEETAFFNQISGAFDGIRNPPIRNQRR